METVERSLGPDSPEVLRLASQFVARQPRVGFSPAEADEEGRVNLCAAACLAKAGMHLSFSESAARNFEEEIAATLSSSLLEDAFERLGWDMSVCQRVRQANNNLPAGVRKPEVLRMFEKLRREG